jgi:type III restriction enzyme
LSEGIRDRILKEVGDNIRAYSFDANVEGYVAHVVEDFFKEYGDVTLPDGTPAKLAIYFPQTDDVAALRPVIDAKLVELGLAPTLVLEHHTHNDNKADFDRFKTKDSPHRVALLVDRGVEGWDVPALFACALARKLKSSNNFVLQASSRCLRQVPGNNKPARIYLSNDNRATLDRELRENYGESLEDLLHTTSNSRSARIVLRKLDIPPLVVKQIVRTIVRKEKVGSAVTLARPTTDASSFIEVTKLTIDKLESMAAILQQVADTIEIKTAPKTIDLYTAAVELAAVYRLDMWQIYDELRRIYPNATDIPSEHVAELARQIEEQQREYEIKEEVIEVRLALVKPQGFDMEIDPSGTEIYTAEISYSVTKQDWLVPWDKWKDTAGRFGFHYSPYNFDSDPEASFFENLLRQLQLTPDQIEDVYFTGAITSPNQTDFYVDYKAPDETWHRYTPDFLIRRKNGKCLIVEIKDARFEAETNADFERDARGDATITIEGRKAVALKKWEKLDPQRLKYEILFVDSESVGYDEMTTTREFIEE